LDFAVWQEPNKRFIVKVDNLDAVAPRVVEIAAKRRLELQLVFFRYFLAHFLDLFFIANDDPEMSDVHRLDLVDFKDRKELVLAEFEKRVAFAAVHWFEIEDVFVKHDCLFDVIDFDRDVIASVDVDTHFVIYTDGGRDENVRSSWMSSAICRFCCLLFSALP
jgi:hypothetical protein